MSAPGSVPFTSPSPPGPGRKSRHTPTATPRPAADVPQPRSDVPRSTPVPLDVFEQTRTSLAESIRPSDARQLGIDVSPPSALVDLSRPAWVRSVVDAALVDNRDELLAIQNLEDAGYSTASSLPSSVASTPAKAGRHGDTSREYDDGFSRHAGAALNDAVIAGRSGSSDASSAVSDQTGIDEFLAGIDDGQQ